MKCIPLLSFLLSLAFCSELKQEPYLCLGTSSIWFDRESAHYLLSATDCNEPSTHYFLTSQGKVVEKSELPDAFELSHTSLFSNEFGVFTNLQFLRPFMSLIVWGSIRNDGMILDHSDLANFPMNFWREIPPSGAAQLLAKVPDTAELVKFIRTLKSNEAPIHKFVLSAPVPMKASCHGPSEQKLCYPGDSLFVVSSTTQTGNGSPRAVIRQEAHVPTFLWRKLFSDHDLVEPEQPLYVYSKMY
jgi:hypothetical protein